ncbi:GRF zinc finger containing protein [Striga asiatica]|uniref:GRF zinc finger containing protein n=1 Tax=Striga asiatica TaxID=4170 RepID=A0A5A7PDD1_STRAF|nr:GRF zinc finger containing protein [Striga asiatica]
MSFVTGSVDCYCGRRAVIRTSWTTENPGLRFQACLKNEEGGGCVFFDWYDPPMCRRAKALIPGLLKKMNANEEDILKLKKETLGGLGLKLRTSSIVEMELGLAYGAACADTLCYKSGFQWLQPNLHQKFD